MEKLINFKLYFVEVKYYSEFEETYYTNSFYAFAKDLGDLGSRIDKVFNYIEKVKIREVNEDLDDSNFFYVDGLSRNVIELIDEANKL